MKPVMNPLSTFTRWLFEAQPQNAMESHERYLSESADLYDLERRQRALEQHQPHHFVLGPFGWNT
jgi:hypothetical protein